MTSGSVGQAGENTKTVRLVSLLRKKGFSDASFEKIFKIVDPTTHKLTSRKPDIVFTDGGTNVVSAKDGEKLERKAVSTAYGYLRDLASVTRVGEVFALTYPKQSREKYHLHVLPLGGRDEVSLVLGTLRDVADAIANVIQGRVAELAKKQEPTLSEAERLLRYAAYELADSLVGIPDSQLETVFGGQEFFHSVFQRSLKGKRRQDALRLGTAFLFVNQILFYSLLSQAAKKARLSEEYPEIEELDKNDPQILQEKYFSRVKAKDYEPIYGLVLTQYFKKAKVGVFLSELIDTISILISKLKISELVGQIFQNLIPFEIRKPLGAHYTNPNAAAFLARISVTSPDVKVLDPACGSGTLLVATYRQKVRLAGKHDPVALHKQFVEQDVTGIDAMAFSSHLAAVNLALQQPLTDTEYVRIGTEDSTRLHPHDIIQPTSELWPEELTQSKISDDFAVTKATKGKIRRVPALRSDEARPIKLEPVDVVIMNPPFTSQNNLAPEYRNRLKRRFSIPSSHKEVVFWKTSQQVFFVLLADRFLRDNGILAAILPFTTFTGRAFQRLIKFLVKQYSIRTIVVGLGQASFSEDTSLMECLFVASKHKPKTNSCFNLVGTKLPPSQWSSETIDKLSSAATAEAIFDNTDTFVARTVSQKDLLAGEQTLSLLYLRLNSAFETAWLELQRILSKSVVPLRRIRSWFDKGLEITEVYHGEDRPLKLGPKAILMCRSPDRAVKNIDRLILKIADDSTYTFIDKISDKLQFTFLKTEVTAAIRRFSFFDSMDISGKTDFCVAKAGKSTEKAMNAFYTKKDSKNFLQRLRRKRWTKILTHGSSKTAISARADLAAPGTRLVSFYSDQPCFLAGAYGYTVRGFRNELEEKFFTLWMNSTPALLQLMAKSTITRGSWIKLEQFTTEQVLIPDTSRISKSNWMKIDQLWKLVSRASLPSLLTQLEQNDEVRLQLDSTLLALLGVSQDKTKSLAMLLEKGALEAIRMLNATMKKPELG